MAFEGAPEVDFGSLTLSLWLNMNDYSDYGSLLAINLGVNSFEDACVVTQSAIDEMFESLKTSGAPLTGVLSLKQRIQFKRDFIQLIKDYNQYKKQQS